MAITLLNLESKAHSIQPTALIHTALRRSKTKGMDWSEVKWSDRGKFLRFMHRIMRQALVDHARKRDADRRPQIEYVDSSVDNYELYPAKRELIEEWFRDNAEKFRPGDTLFFYVTDHGEINKDDLTDNTIVLWKEKMSVSELREIFSRLPSGLRTVMLMSQCFSGSFARTVCSTGSQLTTAIFL